VRRSNGLPFASLNGLYNLSRLSVCWLRLGIAIERIKPGHPQTIHNPFGTCHPCLRYVLSPMSPGRTHGQIGGLTLCHSFKRAMT
jgi:hypothetical protein